MTKSQKILALLAEGPKTYRQLDKLLPPNVGSAIKQLEKHGCVKRSWHDQGDNHHPHGKKFIYLFEATGKQYKPHGRTISLPVAIDNTTIHTAASNSASCT